MKKIYILRRSGKVFQHFFLLMLLFSLFAGKINAQTYVNGNLSTGTLSDDGTTAPAGFTWSEVQAGNGTAGLGANIGAGFSLADDFTVPAGPSWNLTKITFYAYSTGWAGAGSPFNDTRVQIFNTDPSVGNPTPIYGDLTTNRFSASSSAGMYRIFNATPGTTRKIWKIEATVAVTLAPGTYWIEWEHGTSTAGISNFSPPSTVTGTVTQPGNNAHQHDQNNALWTQALDGANVQDMPFSIDYSTGPCAGTPTPGQTISSAATICPGINISLSLQNATPGAGVTYQWQSSPDGLTFTDIPGATNSTYSTQITAATYFQAVVTCSGNSGTSTPVQVLSTPSSGCYCDAGSPDTFFEKIGNVTYSNVNQSSTSTGGYENFLTDTATVVQQSTLPITITIDGPFATDQVFVWIDFNQNGNFSDPGERVFASAPGVGPHVGNITIPATSLLGPTRMRVRLHDSGGFTPNSTPCGDSDYGQVEDYTVNIVPCVPLDITTPPADVTIGCGEDATFSVTSTGSGPAFSWEQRVDASSVWTAVVDNTMFSGSNTNTLTIKSVPVSMNGYQYRAVFSGYCRSTDFTAPATLTVNPLVAVVDPPSADICNGSSQQLAITNTLGNVISINEGFDVVSPLPAGWSTKQNSLPLGPTGWYQGDNVNFFDANSGAADSYIAADYANTDPLGIGTISNWLISPAVSIKNGDIITFYSRIPTGTEYPDRLELRISENGASTDVGNTETSVGDFTNVLLTINPTLVTGVYPKVWTQFTATVSGLAAPTTGRIAFRYFVENAGGNAPNGDYIGIDDVNYISVGNLATGVWTGPAGTMFTDAGLTTAYTGTPENTIYVNPTATATYSVVVTTPICTSDPTDIPVTVNNAIGTVTDPSSAAICAGGNTSFTVATASGNDIEYEWEVSTDGGATWNTVSNGGIYSGATTATLTLTGAGSSLNNAQYHVILTVAACSSTVTSGAATLTVNPIPTVTIAAAPTTQLYPGITTTLTASSSPAGATYQWYKDGVIVPGATAATLVVTVDGLGEYSVTVVDVNGCSGSSTATQTITAAPNDIMFIYPSPTSGQFQVRYQSATGNVLARTLTVYDSKGARVYSKSYNINVPYGRMDVDLSGYSKGIYRVELGDYNGKRIKAGTVIIL